MSLLILLGLQRSEDRYVKQGGRQPFGLISKRLIPLPCAQLDWDVVEGQAGATG